MALFHKLPNLADDSASQIELEMDEKIPTLR